MEQQQLIKYIQKEASSELMKDLMKVMKAALLTSPMFHAGN
jgi:hypothetical protein